MTILSEFATPKFKLTGRFRRQKKTPERGWLGKSRSKLHTTFSGVKYVFGIGDQTLDTAKGLEAISSNVTIGIPSSSLNPTFVNLCKSSKIKKPQGEYGGTHLG